jgi:drug/metabolite transporter (DMT)-like permease
VGGLFAAPETCFQRSVPEPAPLPLSVFLAMLASAFLHAAWNAWVKSRRDANAAVAALVIGAAFPSAGVIAGFGLPAGPAWPWIACTVTLSIGSLTLLARAYREGDFAVAFPMIRGLIPVVLALAAIPLFGEAPRLSGALGVLCVSAGLVLIGWESARRSRTITMRGLAFVALAALVTAVSVMTDAKGARLSQNPFGYAATIAVLNGIAMAVLQTLRGRRVTRMLIDHWPITFGASAVSMVSYQLFIWSLQHAPVALVGAMRETSMLFALMIALFVLGERFGLWRWAAVALMLAGMGLMRL